jgi:hypothetical protein
MNSLLGILIPLFVPIILQFNLLNKTRSGLEWLLNLWMVVSLTLYMFLGEGWFLSSYYFRYLSLVILIVFVVISFFQLPPGAWKLAQIWPPDWKTFVWYLAPSLIFSILLANQVMGTRYTGAAVNLQFPLKDGTYLFAQAGSTGILNQHHDAGSQNYAQDIIGMDKFGRHASTLVPASLEEYEIFGKPIYSPCDGEIVTVRDGLEDIKPGDPLDTAHAAGNHVYITCREQNVQVLLAHMKKGSLSVKPGDTIKTGDPIGLVGNSGNTTEPHLHIHARVGGNLEDITDGTPIPVLFGGKFYIRNMIYNDSNS